MKELTTLPETPSARSTTRASSITELDQRRVADWIRDAFAILCVRASGRAAAEVHLRLGFEAILRLLGTSPLQEIAHAHLPAFQPAPLTAPDLRTILKALDSCLAVFARYEPVLTPMQRHLHLLVRATRRSAEDALHAHALGWSAKATPTAPARDLPGSAWHQLTMPG